MGGSGGDGWKLRKITYHPLPSQRKFHKSKARFKGFSGPIGSGKSQALCHEAIKLAYINSGRMGLIGAPTYPMLRDATLATLLEILSQNKIPFEMNRAENYLVLTETRSRISFRAVEEFERLRGSNLAWFGLDELTYTSEEAWLRLEGRLRDPKAQRLCGFAVWTPKGFDWVYERFVARRVAGYETVLAAPFENRFLLDRIPDYYERLKRSYDGRFFQQEALGEYVPMHAGRVYYAFDRNKNVRPAQLNWNLPLRWALDFNVDPMCSVLAQIDHGTVHVLDEIVLGGASTYEACEEFANRYPSHAAGVVVYADASGMARQTTGTSDVAILREFFRSGAYGDVKFRVAASNPPVRDRVMLMNAKLAPTDSSTALLVAEGCTELMKDFEQVVYKDGTQVIDKNRDSRRTHLSDALGYLVWTEFRRSAPMGRGQRLI